MTMFNNEEDYLDDIATLNNRIRALQAENALLKVQLLEKPQQEEQTKEEKYDKALRFFNTAIENPSLVKVHHFEEEHPEPVEVKSIEDRVKELEDGLDRLRTSFFFHISG